MVATLNDEARAIATKANSFLQAGETKQAADIIGSVFVSWLKIADSTLGKIFKEPWTTDSATQVGYVEDLQSDFVKTWSTGRSRINELLPKGAIAILEALPHKKLAKLKESIFEQMMQSPVATTAHKLLDDYNACKDVSIDDIQASTKAVVDLHNLAKTLDREPHQFSDASNLGKLEASVREALRKQKMNLCDIECAQAMAITPYHILNKHSGSPPYWPRTLAQVAWRDCLFARMSWGLL